jgi:uncharacterized membrane protein YphA (DoxX/SURF4 family)
MLQCLEADGAMLLRLADRASPEVFTQYSNHRSSHRTPREEAMKARTIGYWVCTVLIALSFLSGGLAQLLQVPQSVEGLTRLGYPIYFIQLLGVWKVLGAVAILVPRFATLKEWAYAGMFFDLTGASISHAAMASELRHVIVPLVLAGLVVASWALRPESRKLKDVGLRTQRAQAG